MGIAGSNYVLKNITVRRGRIEDIGKAAEQKSTECISTTGRIFLLKM